jgi:hypothetical protein
MSTVKCVYEARVCGRPGGGGMQWYFGIGGEAQYARASKWREAVRERLCTDLRAVAFKSSINCTVLII